VAITKQKARKRGPQKKKATTGLDNDEEVPPSLQEDSGAVAADPDEPNLVISTSNEDIVDSGVQKRCTMCYSTEHKTSECRAKTVAMAVRMVFQKRQILVSSLTALTDVQKSALRTPGRGKVESYGTECPLPEEWREPIMPSQEEIDELVDAVQAPANGPAYAPIPIPVPALTETGFAPGSAGMHLEDDGEQPSARALEPIAAATAASEPIMPSQEEIDELVDAVQAPMTLKMQCKRP
jgi:hypothetical protein